MKGWLHKHLETFVKPYLGFIPPDSAAPHFTRAEMTVIKNCWKSAKACAMGKKILLTGRDVFVFEILARREGYPTFFLPQCSRASVAAIKIDNKEEVFLFDTGFVGSIPAALEIKNFKLLSYFNRYGAKEFQIFPRLTLSRGLALKIEKTPKYWQTGRIVDGEVIQELNGKEEFELAAKLTLEVYKNSAARFVDKPRPLGDKRCFVL